MPMPSSFDILGPNEPLHPVILSVPHAGRQYPAAAAGLLRLGLPQLLSLEDRYADLLVDTAVAQGTRAIVARTPRLWVDLNRDEQEFDREMIRGTPDIVPIVTAKVRGGLGLIPRKIARGGDIWRRHLSTEELEARIRENHRPYHAALATLLAETRARFGVAILLDVHSMPSLATRDMECPAQVVVGDRFGRSALGRFTARATFALELCGLPVAVNTPYSGGYILNRHGAPGGSIHALQLEFDRRLYLEPSHQQPSEGIARIRDVVARLVRALADEATTPSFAIAAE